MTKLALKDLLSQLEYINVIIGLSTLVKGIKYYMAKRGL